MLDVEDGAVAVHEGHGGDEVEQANHQSPDVAGSPERFAGLTGILCNCGWCRLAIISISWLQNLL